MFKLFAKAKFYVLGALIGFLGIIGAFWSGSRSGRLKSELEQEGEKHEAFKETTERMADVRPADNVGASRERLRERGKR